MTCFNVVFFCYVPWLLPSAWKNWHYCISFLRLWYYLALQDLTGLCFKLHLHYSCRSFCCNEAEDIKTLFCGFWYSILELERRQFSKELSLHIYSWPSNLKSLFECHFRWIKDLEKTNKTQFCYMYMIYKNLKLSANVACSNQSDSKLYFHWENREWMQHSGWLLLVF